MSSVTQLHASSTSTLPTGTAKRSSTATQFNDSKKSKLSIGNKPTTTTTTTSSSSNSSSGAIKPGSTVTPIDTQPKVKSQFIVDIEYINQLPDIPLDCKLLKLHYNTSHITNYCMIDFDINDNKPELYHSVLLDSDINFIDTDQYTRSNSVKYGTISEADLAMFDPSVVSVLHSSNSPNEFKSSIQQQLPSTKALIQQNTHNWLKKDIYLTNNLSVNVNNRMINTIKPSFSNNQQNRSNNNNNMDELQKQIELIEQTFIDSITTPIHPTKKQLTVKSIQYIYPHQQLIDQQQYNKNTNNDTNEIAVHDYSNAYTWIEFDVDPLKKYHESDHTTDIPSINDLLIQQYNNNINDNAIHYGLYVRDCY